MRFARIEMLFLVWTIPLLLLAYVYGARKRRRILRGFAASQALGKLMPPGMAGRRRLKAALVIAAGMLLVVALAGPQYGFQWQEIESQGVDIIIALDCSRSMLAQDIPPTRLGRAKREIYDLLNMLQGDRVGLVAFSGTAFLQCPLTIDYQAFNLFLDVLTPDYLPVGGTDLTAAVNIAVEAFKAQSPADKAIILITDGENTGRGDPMLAAQAAQKAGIKLFSIGVGSDKGVPIPEARGGFKKDAAGRIVMTQLDESLLTRMALATGGSYVRSVAGDMDLDTIYRDQIRAKMATAAVESGRKQVWADRFQWPLALAVLLLWVALWLPAMEKTAAAAVFVLLLCISHPPALAGPLQEGFNAYQKGDYDKALQQFIQGQLENPENPDLLYNLGNAFYKKGDYAAAREHYTQTLDQAGAELKPDVLYNLGNAAYRQDDLQEAVRNYEAALKLAPNDRQARENLAFVKKKLQEQQQKHPDQQKGPTQDPKEQQNQTGQAQNQNQDRPADQPQDQGANPSQASEPKENGNHPQPPTQFAPELPPEQGAGSDQPQAGAPQPREQNGQPGPRPVEQPAAAHMLNRLKDQPGRAMMPNYQRHPVDKDW